MFTLQVDASQGAEEMLEHLTDKVLHQEEQIQQLEEEKNDLASSRFFGAVCVVISVFSVGDLKGS